MMRDIREGKENRASLAWLFAGLLLVVGAAFYTASRTGANFFAHSNFDTYTLQAMTWRAGRVMLDQNYPWLELAIYQGNYYVSFPPVPSIPMWMLSFVFGESTPSGLVTLLYFLGAYVAAFFLCRRYLRPFPSMALSVFMALGGSLLDLAVSDGTFSGSVWYQAQLLALLLTLLAFYLMDGEKKSGWFIGLGLFALAVGCRPFHALYVPVLLWMLYQKLPGETLWKRVRAMVPYIIAPALIACAYGAYNYARFGNPLEFGHAYLPEFTESGEPMFSLAYLWPNIQNILRPIHVGAAGLTFPIISGFAVYLTNPMLVLSVVRGGERIWHKKTDSVGLLLCAAILLHAATLLLHRTNGGWQYGTRYLCDLLPALVFGIARAKLPIRRVEVGAMAALCALNVYGTIVFHILSN